MEKSIAINVSHLKESEIILFIRTMQDTIYSGKGSRPLLGKALGLNRASPLRYLLGWPESELTLGRQRFAEAIWSQLFKVPLADCRNIWTDSPVWQPENPNATRREISQSRLDTDFIASFGLPDTAWEEEVLFSSKVLGRSKREKVSPEENLRAYAALTIFGFLEPEIFFKR